MLDEQDEVLERELLEVWLDLVHYGSGYVLVHAILVNKVETLDYFLGADGTRAIRVEVAESCGKSIARLKHSLIDGPHQKLRELDSVCIEANKVLSNAGSLLCISLHPKSQLVAVNQLLHSDPSV